MTAIQANEAKAFDYLPKPFDLPDLMTRVGKALQSRRTLSRGGSEQGAMVQGMGPCHWLGQPQSCRNFIARLRVS